MHDNKIECHEHFDHLSHICIEDAEEEIKTMKIDRGKRD